MTSPQQPSQKQVSQAAHRFDVHRGFQTVQTEQQATSRADQHAKALAAYGGLVGSVLAPAVRLVDEAEAVTQFDNKLPAEVKALKKGLATRSAPAFQPANYDGYSHTTLHQMVTQGVDPGKVGAVGDTWLEMGNDLTQFQNHIASALASSETTWQGTAGDNARRSVAKLGNTGAAAGQAAQLAGVVTHQQSEALANARYSMPPPPNPPFNPAAADQQLRAITDPVAFAVQAVADQQAFVQQKQAQQQAAHIVREYDTTLAQTSHAMPAFAPVPPSAKPTSGPTPPKGPTPTRGSSGPSSGGSVLRTAAAGPTTDAATGPTVPGGPTTPAGSPAETVPSNSPWPAPSTIPVGGSPVAGVGAGSGSTANDPLSAGVGVPFGIAGGSAGPGSDPLRSGSGFGPGVGGVGSGGLPGGGRGANGEAPGAGGRSGIGSGAAAAEEAAVEQGMAGPRGPAGLGGGMVPAGRGKGNDDSEHHRPSYLVEPDPDDLFGMTEKIAPPVIGEQT